mgnify:CR=1 FL=1
MTFVTYLYTLCMASTSMDACINARQIQSQSEEGEDDVIVKKQKIETNNIHEEDIDMISKPSYAHVMGEGEDKRNDHYGEVMHVVVDEALHEILPYDIEMATNIEEDEIVEVEMPRWEILKVFSCFMRETLFASLREKFLWYIGWCNKLNAMVGRNSVEDVYKGP